jgi:hypothetical protein
MRQVLFTLICLAIFSSACAQKKKVGFYNHDSLLLLMPGYQSCLDSTKMLYDSMKVVVDMMEKEKTAKQRETDSCQKKDSPLIHSLRLEQLRQIQENIDQYKHVVPLEIRADDSLRRAPYEQRLADAKNKAASEAGCDVAYKESVAKSKYKPEEAEFIDLNNSIAEKLQL